MTDQNRAWQPTKKQLDEFNEIREAVGLMHVEMDEIQTVGDWWRVCGEVDQLADDLTPVTPHRLTDQVNQAFLSYNGIDIRLVINEGHPSEDNPGHIDLYLDNGRLSITPKASNHVEIRRIR